METLLVFLFLVQPPELPVNPIQPAQVEEDRAEKEKVQEYQAVTPKEVQEIEPSSARVHKTGRHDTARSHALPPPPSNLTSQKKTRRGIWEKGLHGIVQGALMLTVGHEYVVPPDAGFSEPSVVLAELSGGLFYTLGFYPHVSVGLDIAVRSGSPLPVFHAGPRVMVDWSHWAVYGYARIGSREEDEDPYNTKHSEGGSIGFGFYYSLPRSPIMGDRFLVGIGMEYWSGEVTAGDETMYDDGPGTFSQKEWIMSMAWTW